MATSRIYDYDTRSGQITERQWQEHLKEDPKLRDAWLYKIDPDNSGWNPIG